MTLPSAATDATRARERAEAEHAWRRIVELRAHPVRGNFDTLHLREVHRRIFQDLPGLGYDDVKPGTMRPAVTGAYYKQRALETRPGEFFVAYSRMDASARIRLADALAQANPSRLKSLDPQEFANAVARLYAEADYVHPFGEGNSRTLRTYTAQVAKEAGYELQWEKFGERPSLRDKLYIARDKAVLERVLRDPVDERLLRTIAVAKSKIDREPGLDELIREVVRPSRAVAFERLSERDALTKHPELAKTFEAREAIRTSLTQQFPTDPQVQQSYMAAVTKDLQRRLDAGRIPGVEPARSIQRAGPELSR
jgi:cell filamentation protein